MWIAVGLLTVGAVAGVRLGVDYVMGSPDPAASGDDSAGHPNSSAEATIAARRAWGQRYGQNRALMPDLPDVASASPEQQKAATDLLTRTQASTAAFASTDAAQDGGYDFASSLAHAKKTPWMSRRMALIDSGAHPAKPLVLRAVNTAHLHDGKVLDPTAPDALIYTYQGNNSWKLVGATFRADEAYPNPPPDPGGPITRWRYLPTRPALLTMDVYFVAANDLAHAYALNPPNQ
jgi:hypothetical protein